jgi:hypothetical protein
MRGWKAALLGLALLAYHASGQVVYADGKYASIQVPAILKIDAGTEAPIPVELVPPTAVPPQAMLLIRGIPASATLNSGRHFPSGVWAVKPSAVPKLRISTPEDTGEDVHLVFSLVTLDGDYVSNVLARLVIAPPGVNMAARDTTVIAAIRVQPEPETNPEAATEDAPAQASPQPRPEPVRTLLKDDIAKILKLMQKGDQYLYEGKIVAARRFYEYAAEIGWPDGAAAIARTFDEKHLRRFPILGGIRPDAKLAQQWYDKSRVMAALIKIDDATRLGQK